MTTVTLRDHLAAQGADATGFYSRGARVQKRAAPTADSPNEPTTFVAVRVEPTPEPTPAARDPLCRITHQKGHVLEFAEWPEPTWLAALMDALPSPSR